MRKLLLFLVLGVSLVLTGAPQAAQFCAPSGCPAVTGVISQEVSGSILADTFIMAGQQSSTETNVQYRTPSNGVISNLFCDVTTAPGAGDTWDITVRLDRANSTLTCQISGAAATACSDLVNTASVVQGEHFSFFWDETGTAVATSFMGCTVSFAARP